MDILVADAFPDHAVAALRDAGHVVRHEPGLDSDSLPGAMAGARILVVRGTKVMPEALGVPGLALVIRAGAGVNTIDVAAASRAGVFVANTPGKNAIAVAELVMGFVLALDRHIPDAVADLRSGRWDKERYSDAAGLAGRTLGIVGVGEIGLEVAKRAAGFEMSVVAVEKEGRPSSVRSRIADIGITLVPDDATMLAQSDFVSLHVPSTPETRGLVDAAFLASMKDGAVLINTSRGDVVDESALIDAMDHRGIRAGLDVFADEPSAKQSVFQSALASHPAVYGTHHIGASTDQAQDAIADEVVRIIGDFTRGELSNCVNLVDNPDGSAVIVQHHNRVGVLAAVLGVLRDAGVNVTAMENRLFTGSESASASITVDGTLDSSTVAEIELLDAVISVAVVEA